MRYDTIYFMYAKKPAVDGDQHLLSPPHLTRNI